MMGREETNNLTREDVLKELELLPVWQLRVPVVSPVEIVQKNTEVQKIAESIVVEASYYALVSEDKKWAFVLPQALTGSAQVLFNNILLALQLNKTHTETLVNLVNTKVIVAMGETSAQRLLNSLEPIETLRGKVHIFENIPLVVTYHPNDMLQYLPNKAKTWDDLCKAKTLAST